MPRTIDDIVPPSRRRSADPTATEAGDTGFTPPPRVKIREGRGFPYITALIAIIVIALSAAALYAFSGAKVEITPASAPATTNGTYTAATDGTGELPFKVISVSKTASVSVPAESTQTVSDSAQGSIVVTNTLTKPEDLVTNTRFQSGSGLIFRVHAPIAIPAATASGPGTLTVTVYADQPGQQYNLAPTTFTVPGLQNTPTYAAVTAKSSATFTGGFTGTRGAVSQNTDSTQQATLQSKLVSDLQGSLTSQIPSDYSLIQGSTFTSYTPNPDNATTTSTVVISQQGTETAVIFPTTDLAKAIAEGSVGTYQGQPVTLDSVSGLTLTPASTTAPTTNQTSFGFSLSGNTTIIWIVDASKIAAAVAGKTRDSAQSILQSFPEVSKATLVLHPFWASTFPTDPSRIQVVVQKPASS